MSSVDPSRIGATLRAARARLGWSRETLAHHSGVSWSAIAQIESGRRRDVRLRSLSALARALGVSVDHLIGRADAATKLLEHRVLPYGSDEEFLAAAIPFLNGGIGRSESLLAVTTEEHIELLRDSLGDGSERLEFADSGHWYRSPDAALNGYRTFVNEKVEAGASWVRIVGEPIWTGRSDLEITAWTRYESLLNLSFAASPVTIVCPYDNSTLPEAVLADARRTHPEAVHADKTLANPAYREPEDFLLDTALPDRNR
jgi:transcriptional regulator with XRE-family HTH domain